MYSDKTLADLMNAFSSPDPTPGGGSAAALSGAMGAALLAMVAGLPRTKHGTPEERALLDAARTDLLTLQAALVGLVDRDAAAYDLVVAAFKLPKGTDDEKTARKAAIQHAMRVATEVPLETITTCAAAAEAARPLGEAGNPSAKTDLAVGAASLMAGMQGAWLNVEINIGSLKDEALVRSITADLRAAMTSAGKAMADIYAGAGIGRMLQDASARAGFPHGHPPADADQATSYARMAAEGLRRLHTPAARAALETLASQSDDTVGGQAKNALARWDETT